jgi:hypothetical protein
MRCPTPGFMMAESSLGKFCSAVSARWWSLTSLTRSVNEVEIHVDVDLGKAVNKAGRDSQKFKVIIRPSCKINMAVLKAYLSNKAGWDTKVLECMSKCFD